ncbi:MAG: DUF2163 domain-containing protein, partial [Gemmatimonadales bacterium]
MQKYIPDRLQSHYDGDALTTCLLTRIKCKDGTLYGYTDLDVNVWYNPATYDPGGTGDDWGDLDHTADTGGFSLARLEASADLSVDNSELKFLPGTGTISAEEILSGIFDSADIRIYRVNYADLSMGHECVAVGQLGNARVAENFAYLEYRSLTDLLKQPEADLYTIPCRKVFGGEGCPKAYTWTAGTVTGVDPTDSQRIFSDSALTPDDDFYVPGVVDWLTGDNAGKQDDIDQNTAGTFALSLPTKFPIQIGDTFRVRQDCSKLWDDAEKGCLYHWGDDRWKYFGGFP